MRLADAGLRQDSTPCSEIKNGYGTYLLQLLHERVF